jgi:hypothetical protein
MTRQFKLLYQFSDLVALGVATNRTQHGRLVKAGRFPAPTKRSANSTVWTDEQIESVYDAIRAGVEWSEAWHKEWLAKRPKAQRKAA